MLYLIIVIAIFSFPLLIYFSPKNQEKLKREQNQKPVLTHYTYFMDNNYRVLYNNIAQPTREDMIKMRLSYGVYFYRFITKDQYNTIISDYTIPITFLPPNMLYPKDVNMVNEILPFEKKQIIKNGEDKIFRAITKICFAHKKYCFLQVRLLDVISISTFSN